MKNLNLYVLALSAIIFTGCESVKDTLGLSHSKPDEFLVSTNPPLELPPHSELRPPREGQEGQNSNKTAEDAQKTLGLEIPEVDHKNAQGLEKEILDKADKA